MAGIDPIDLNPMGSEDILFAGYLGCILPFSKIMLMKMKT
jgi:hypothetical protein